MEVHLYCDLNCNWFSIFDGWLEYPTLDSLYRLFVHAKAEPFKYSRAAHFAISSYEQAQHTRTFVMRLAGFL